jgi:hypothetical protein
MVLGLVSDREDDVKRLPPLEADKAVKSFIDLKQVRIDLSEGKENIHGKEGSTYDHRVNVAADPEYVAGNVAFDAVSRWLTSSDKPQA